MSSRSVEGKTPLDALGVGELLGRGGGDERGGDEADNDGDFGPHRSVGVTRRETSKTERAGVLLVCELILILIVRSLREACSDAVCVDTGAKAHFTTHSPFGWSLESTQLSA
jgi:hypothetical protein